VTLAALIVTLGMIVDNSIVIIDSYLEKIGEGMSRWHASVYSATHFFKSIFSATLAISITFFPFLIVIPGMIHDFLLSFPWAITLILGISLLVAMLQVPFMQFWFIRKPVPTLKKGFSFMTFLQTYYNKLLDKCFAHPYVTLSVGVLSVLTGIFLLGKLPQKLMPVADRNQFAVEIYLPTGTSVEETAHVVDTMENVLRRDERVVSVTSFVGCSSPRFHTAYAPQLGGTNYAQLIVNTKGNKETVELLDEYSPRYTDAFPKARVRFKQISFSQSVYPIELRLSGENMDSLKIIAEKYLNVLRQMPEIRVAQTNFSEPQTSAKVVLKEDEASRLGIQNMQLETTLAMRYGNGINVANVWEGDYDIPVTLKSEQADCAGFSDLENELIPVLGGTQVPLRQIAEVIPTVKDGQLVRRNGIYTITVMADVCRDVNVTALTRVVKEKLATISLPDNITLTYGGDDEQDNENLPPIMGALAIAAFIIFFILLAHFKRISIALLIFTSMTLCIFGTSVGVLLQGVDFGMTCTLGIISLMGIIVRNGIIMIDYAEELRVTEKLCVHDAIYHSARRRMRPIFLTSAAASMGVIPMILGKSGLWMPMGTVICYGTLITMLFLLTVLPVSYLLIFRGSTRKRAKMEALENA
jgi:multidrug efflux pump